MFRCRKCNAWPMTTTITHTGSNAAMAANEDRLQKGENVRMLAPPQAFKFEIYKEFRVQNIQIS